jgi:hypothetical protein
VEGPFVLKRKGRYYQMFSGGNWQNVTYGVSYATSDRVRPAGEWHQACDGERVLPILRTLPEAGVIGPGHNSVVRGPDNLQHFCVYHRWAPEIGDRVLAIDRLDWVGDELIVLGPTTTPQPAPEGGGQGADGRRQEAGGTRSGQWAEGGEPGERAAHFALPASNFVLEVTVAAEAAEAYGVALEGEAATTRSPSPSAPLPQIHLSLHPAAREVRIRTPVGEWRAQLADDFVFAAEHLLRVEVNGPRARVRVDHTAARWEGAVGSVGRLALLARDGAARFVGLELTAGWEDDFDAGEADPAALGWRTVGGTWRVREGRLRQTGVESAGALAVKGPLLEQYEWVLNVRLETPAGADDAAAGGPGTYGFYPAYAEGDPGPLFVLERRPAGGQADPGWHLRAHAAGQPSEAMPLPARFDPFVDQHFRFRCEGGQVSAAWRGEPLGNVPAPARPGQVGVWARGAISVEACRVAGL